MSLVLTRLQNLRAVSNLDKYEYRQGRYGAFDVFKKQSDDPNGILTQDLKDKALYSIGNVLETPVINYDGDVTISNARSLTIADSENTSKMVQFNFVTYAWGFTVVPSLFLNNEIGMQTDFNKKFLKYLYKFSQTLDTSALAALASNKTQVIGDGLIYDITGKTINAKWTEREQVLADLPIIMGTNDYYSPMFDVVGDAGVESLVKKLQQLGANNAVNKGNEYNDKAFSYTNGFTADATKYAQGYIVAPASLGLLYRFEREVLLNTRTPDGHEWSQAQLPILNIPCGTYYYQDVGNYSTIAGDASADMDRVVKEHYGFAVDVCFVTPYNSSPSTIPTPIMGFNVSSQNASYAAPVVITNTVDNPVNTKAVAAS